MNTTSCRINTVSYSECKNSNHKKKFQIQSILKNRYFFATHYLYSLIPYFLMPSFIICDDINSFMQSTMVLSIRSLIQYLSKRTASTVHYANIVLAVKTCYKIKIDSRESKSRFRSFLASAKPLRQSRTGPPPSNMT